MIWDNEMGKTTKGRRTITNQIKRFFTQTFRKHSGGEYSEFLTRGVNKRKAGINTQYPWVYIRLFAMLVILFAVFLLIIRFTSNELFAPTVMLLSAITFNLPFLVFLYELYPQRDLSFLEVVGIMLIGGTGANVLCQVLYSFFPSPNEWMDAVYSGFFEELSKGAATIIAIVLVGRKNPLSGFLAGAAVGCGFSIVEDMGYVFVYSNELPSINISVTIDMFISRGLTAFCTHTLWTAMVGWAYSYFNRHISNIAFYLVLILSCGLHIAWDLPLEGVLYNITIVACVTIVAVATISIIAVSRKNIFKANSLELRDSEEDRVQLSMDILQPDGEAKESGVTVQADESENVESNLQGERVKPLTKKNSAWWSYAGHLSLVIGVFIMAIFSIIYCSIPFRETYYSQSFDTSQSFIDFMQEDYAIVVNKDRRFDESLPNEYNSEVTVGGVVTHITQRVTEGDFIYYYTYNVVTVDETRLYYYTSVSVRVYINGVYSVYTAEDIYNKGKIYASFFRIRSDVTGYNFDSSGNITVFIYDAAFERDLSQPQYAVLFYSFAGVTGISIILYVAFEIKARRLKKYVG
jgi:RsiW-degrading membrane proteinase PrsW (M82 family)